jgi:hypothetical protein
MLRAPTWKQSMYSQHRLNLRDLHHLGDDQQPILIGGLAHDLQAFQPMPWKLYGELRGLNAPPRKTARRPLPPACALSRIWSRLSTEHGPDMNTISSPPTTSPFGNVIRVPSGRNPRPASLYGDEMRYAWCTPGEHLELRHLKVRRRSHSRKNGLRLTRSPVDVESQLHHALDHMLYLFIGGWSCIATIITGFLAAPAVAKFDDG